MTSRRCAEWRFPTEKQQRAPRANLRRLRWPPRRLAETKLGLLPVSCSRCMRIIDIRTAVTLRLYEAGSTWREWTSSAGEQLSATEQSTRSHDEEEDGCWPRFTELRS